MLTSIRHLLLGGTLMLLTFLGAVFLRTRMDSAHPSKVAVWQDHAIGIAAWMLALVALVVAWESMSGALAFLVTIGSAMTGAIGWSLFGRSGLADAARFALAFIVTLWIATGDGALTNTDAVLLVGLVTWLLAEWYSRKKQGVRASRRSL